MTTMLNITTPDPTQLPDVVLTTQGNLAATQLVTIRNVQFVCEASGMTPRLNMATGAVHFHINGKPVEDRQAETENAELAFLDLCTCCHMKNKSDIREIIANLAKFDPFHPMEDWLKSLPEPGGDPIGDLVNTVKTDNPLWPVYLENWLVQVVEGVCGWRDRQAKKSLPYVLVLVGGQGLGKSHWFKRLGGRWLKGEAELHLSSPAGKDQQLEALKFPMVELAELDGIFRKVDISHMKAFISREEDSLRAPYDRRALVRPRMTTFCGSVNEAEFLNDSTGSRRFWPVQVESIVWDSHTDLDAVWAHAYHLWWDNPDFHLTREEDDHRSRIAVDQHFTESTVSETVRRYLECHQGMKKFEAVPMSALDVLNLVMGRRNYNNKDKSDAKAACEKILGKSRTIEGKQRSWWVNRNENVHDMRCWPDKINHLSLVRDTLDPPETLG